uniref:Signal peptide protein n=1 Tax=Steinernema glaseri TaxID=37863 RepID=A0A1I7ZJP6_9BILA
MQNISVLSVFLLGCVVATSLAEQAFAITDKVGQGNFAKVYGFADGELYRLGKRNSEGVDAFAFANPRDPRQRFAKHNGQTSDFAFAFAKRANFAKRDDASDDVDGSRFAFAKRAGNFALLRPFA